MLFLKKCSSLLPLPHPPLRPCLLHNPSPPIGARGRCVGVNELRGPKQSGPQGGLRIKWPAADVHVRVSQEHRRNNVQRRGLWRTAAAKATGGVRECLRVVSTSNRRSEGVSVGLRSQHVLREQRRLCKSSVFPPGWLGWKAVK